MTGAQTTNITVPMEQEIADRAESLFEELGMSVPTAINVFVRQALREGGFPFDITACKPNKETIMAMLEAEKIANDPNAKTYTDLDELFKDLKSDD